MTDIEQLNVEDIDDQYQECMDQSVGQMSDMTIVFWNGKERVPLVVEAVDGAVIVLGDARRFLTESEGGSIPDEPVHPNPKRDILGGGRR